MIKKGGMGSHVKKYRGQNKGETELIQKGVSHTIIHPSIRKHILILIVRFVSSWIHSLTLQYVKWQYDYFLPYFKLHKGFIFSRKEKEARIALVRNNTHRVIREGHSRNLVLDSKFKKKTSG